MVKQTIVIGAGASGLICALRLVEAGFDDIAILEAEGRVGGRIWTIPKNGSWLELGAQWIHGKGQNPLWKFVQKHQIPISAETNRDGEGLFIRNDGLEIPSNILEETLTQLDLIHDSDKYIDNPAPVEDKLSMGEVFRQEFELWLQDHKIGQEPLEHTQWRRQFYQWYIKWEECDTGCDNLDEQSIVAWGQYVDYDDDTSFAEGYKSFLDKIQELLTKSRVKILLNHEVKEINYEPKDGRVDEVMVKCADGQQFSASHVVSTASLGYLKKHHETLFVPQLSSQMQEAIKRISFGTIDRVKLDFSAPFWDASNPGYMILWDRDINKEPLNKSNWVQHVVGFDSILKQPNMLMAWVSGDAARIMETLSDEEIGRDLCDLLKMITKQYIPNVKTIEVTRWHSNPFQLGTYSYRSPATDALKIGHDHLGEPIVIQGVPRILFGGEATDVNHFGTVHGALTAGEREAKRLIAYLKV